MNQHPHLTPVADAADPEGVAVLTFDRALRDGVGPRAAMSRAFEAAGVADLEARLDEATGELADRDARIAELEATLADVRTAAGPTVPVAVAPPTAVAA